VRSELGVVWRVLGDAFLRFVTALQVRVGEDLNVFCVRGGVWTGCMGRDFMKVTVESGASK
jgi:hypothetical protein